MPTNKVDDIYRIKPKAIYKGELFFASFGGEEDKILLDTDDAELAKKMDFERTDKYMYSKYVDIGEVEIIEEKKPYPANQE